MSSSTGGASITAGSPGAVTVQMHDSSRASSSSIGRSSSSGRTPLQKVDSSILDAPQPATPGQVAVWKIIHRQKKIRASYLELFLHLLFSAIFLGIILMQRSIYGSYLMNQGIATALITQDISDDISPFPKTFLDVGQWDEARDYLLSVVGGTLDNDVSYSGKEYTSDEKLYIQYNNRLIGGIRLRQLRVKNDSCEIPDQMNKIESRCYSNDYTESTRDTKPFGPDGKYNYTSEKDSGSADIWGYAGSWYEGGGYIVDIPQGSNFTERIQELVDDEWWDRGTRVIIVSLNMMNAALDARVAVVYLMLEMTAGGAVAPSSIIKIFRLNLYLTSLDRFRAFLEIIFVIMLVYWMVQEYKEYRRTLLRTGGYFTYFFDMWNLMEVINLLAFTATVIMYLDYVLSPSRNTEVDGVQYVPKLEGLASKAINYYNISAFNILICSFRTFKYFRLNDRMSVLWNALRRASGDIFSFLIMFFFLLFGFIFMGLLTFGTDNKYFNTVANAWGSCWNFVLGNPPDYATLTTSNRVLGPIFFMLFTVLIFFIMINMFIAILSDSLVEVHKSNVSPQGGLSTALTRGIKQLVNTVKELPKRKTGRKSMKVLIESMNDPSILDRDNVTYEEMKNAIGPDATPAQAKQLIMVHQQLHSGEYSPSLVGDIPMDAVRASRMARNNTTSIATSSPTSNTPGPSSSNSNTKSGDIDRLRDEVRDLHNKLDAVYNLLLASKKTN